MKSRGFEFEAGSQDSLRRSCGAEREKKIYGVLIIRGELLPFF